MGRESYKYPVLAELGESVRYAAGITVTLALGLAPRNSRVRGGSTSSPVPCDPDRRSSVERRHDAVHRPDQLVRREVAFAPHCTISCLASVRAQP